MKGEGKGENSKFQVSRLKPNLKVPSSNNSGTTTFFFLFFHPSEISPPERAYSGGGCTGGSRSQNQSQSGRVRLPVRPVEGRPGPSGQPVWETGPDPACGGNRVAVGGYANHGCPVEPPVRGCEEARAREYPGGTAVVVSGGSWTMSEKICERVSSELRTASRE